MNKSDLKLILAFTVIALIIKAFCLDIGLFWDNVLFVGKMGTWLYEHSLFNWLFPNSFDPGHPPFIAFVNALGWHVFGRSLMVSHLLMVPFIVGFFWQLFRFISHYTSEEKYRWLFFFIVIVDPTLSAQLVLVSPEVIQLLFFFMAVNSIFEQKHLKKGLALAILGIVTFRGMMLCAGIFIYELLRQLYCQKNTLRNFVSKEMIISYIIGAIPAVSFIGFRLLTKGWLQSHPESPWSQLWQFVNFNEFVRNVIILINRYADFGRLGVILFIGILWTVRHKSFKSSKIKELLILSIASVFVIIVTSLISTNAFGHRYFITSYIVLIVLALNLAQQLKSNKWFAISFIWLLLTTGNLWIYPRSISQGWDASLACYPYFGLREDMIEYMDDNNIEVKETASFFANYNTIDLVDINGDQREFQKFTGNEEYVFYSTVYNLSDEELSLLDENYNEIRQFEKCRIEVVLYQRK